MPKFWVAYDQLPEAVRRAADRKFELLKADERHPSLHFNRIGDLWSARVDSNYRALGLHDDPDTVYWFWIGPHDLYDRIISRT